MKYLQIRSVEDLLSILKIHPLSLKRWFKNYPFGSNSDNCAIRNKVLVGKPVIAAFMGISVKTLKRWFVKYPTLPVERAQYRCYALTNNLMLWKVYRELRKMPDSCIAVANDRIATNYAAFMGVTKKFYLEHYIRRYDPNHPFLRARIYRARHYRKTVEKALELLWLSRSLLEPSADNDRRRIFYTLSPPWLVTQNKRVVSTGC